jgi:hypothetical protein
MDSHLSDDGQTESNTKVYKPLRPLDMMMRNPQRREPDFSSAHDPQVAMEQCETHG